LNTYFENRLPIIVAAALSLVLIGSIISSANGSEEYKFVRKWGSQGSGDGEFASPHGLAIDASSSDVYVTQISGDHRVQKFTSAGEFITKWGSQGSSDGQFHFPQGIAVSSTGSVFVVDTFNHRIQKFDGNGNFITKWGSQGSRDGQLDFPAEIAVDSSDNIYVGDKNRRIQKYTSDGEFITKWGSFCNLGTGSGCLDPDGQEGPLSSGDGQFLFPQGIALDHSGNVYVADIFNNRIEVFALTTDTSAPDTTITSMIDGNSRIVTKGGSSSSNSITFNFEGTDNQGFKCTLDQNNGENCMSPKTYINLLDGKHTFSVFAIDTSSNKDLSPASFDWIVDRIAPIVSVPSSDIVVQATSSSGAIVTYSATAHDNLDGDLTPTCNPPSGSTFAIGSTNVNCQAVDKAGNTGTASFNILVEESPKPSGEPTSLALKINPNRAIAAGHDFSLSGRLFNAQSRPMSFAGLTISFSVEPSAMTIPSTQTDKQGKFSLSGLKAPGDGSYEIIAHFAGTSLLKPSKSSALVLKVEKHTTSLRLEIKGNPSSALLTGILIDASTGKGIASQTISFTTDRSGLIINDASTDSKGKYKTSIPSLQCGTGVIHIQSHFAGNSASKPSDSRAVSMNTPNCSTNSVSSNSPNSKVSSSPLRAHSNQTEID
jgi:sugar lactone lactonase YvrE